MFGFFKKKVSKNIVSSINNKFDENEFWDIISMFDWNHESADEFVVEPAICFLSKKTDSDIEAFQDILARLLYKLDGVAFAMNIGEESYVNEETYFSPDGFLYSRCVVIANGINYYTKVINDPTEMPKDLEFESILYVAHNAYKRKNNRDFNYSTKYDFETFSNKEQW